MANLNAKAYIDGLSARGEVSFTLEKMRVAMRLTAKAAERAIYRLRQKKEIAVVARGYYLILTPEFRALGCLPPDYFVDDLMRHWQQTYYVCLLSAALYFGAAHQQPQIFQVMTNRYRCAIRCGHVKINFVLKKTISTTPTTSLKTHAGEMKISTPESTMMDLCLFIRRSGGLGHVLTVLDELAESVTPMALEELLKQNNEMTWVQRLGYMLEYLGHSALSEILYEYIRKQKANVVPLMPGYSMLGVKRDPKWRIAINAVIEDDLRDTN